MARTEKASPSEISKAINIKPQALANIMLEMEKAGHIQREMNPNNRRMVIVSLTEEGRQYGRQYCKHELESLKNFLDFLGEEDTNNLMKILDKVGEYFEEV